MIKDAKWAREVIQTRIENEKLEKEVNDKCDRLVEVISLQKPIDDKVSHHVVPSDYRGLWEKVKAEMIRRGFFYEIRNTFYYFVLVM